MGIASSESAEIKPFGWAVSMLVMHPDNMMDEWIDGPTHFSWSAL